MSQKRRVFGYFSTTTGWNRSRFSALVTLGSIKTENRQAKPGRFQIRSLKKFSDCTFYTLETVVKIRIFAKNLIFLLFRGVLNRFSSNVKIRNNFIQGTGVVIIFNSISITLRPMVVLQSGLFVRKE